MKSSYKIISFLSILCLLCASCIEDGYTTSPSDQAAFSVDTLDLGVVYTGELTPTHKMTVYNRHSKSLNLSRVQIQGPNAQNFRINVDGMSGDTFENVEIRANDSIFVMVDAFLPEGTSGEVRTIEADLEFTVNGNRQTVLISAQGMDIQRLQGRRIVGSESFAAGRPYQILDSLVVEEGACLTLEAGARLLFHDKARMVVHGTLVSDGTAEQPVTLTGDRLGEVLPEVSFDIMSKQWQGVEFTESSAANCLSHTVISNTEYGVVAYGCGEFEPKLVLENCRLRNSGECVLAMSNANLEAIGCEFAEASYSLVYLLGGEHRLDQCTIANNYLFTAIGGAAIMIENPADIEGYENVPEATLHITNSIIGGLGKLLYPEEQEGKNVLFERCLLQAAGEDDANFVECLWDIDPMFWTVRNEYYFDYRLQPESPALEHADPTLSPRRLPTDFYGLPLTLELGAYAFDSSL